MKVNQFPDRIIEINNEEFLYFGGTAYLGLPTNEAFQQLFIQNILKWGTAYGSSRTANIKLTAYDNGEDFLAKHINSEAALTISSGMLAGKLVLEVLAKETDCFFHFANIHPALRVPSSLPFFIENELNPRLLNSTTEKITILTDSVPSFHTQAIDLSILNVIPSTKKITLVVDESHSLGILGTNGSGIYSNISISTIKRKIMIASLGKAFGLTGGVIASDSNFIKQVNELDTFISSASMSAAAVQTMADAAIIYLQQHQKLKKNLKYIDTHLLKNKAVHFDVNYPLIYPYIEGIKEILLDNKIIATNFKYPTGTKDLNRIVITANHKKEDLDRIIAILNQNIL